MCFEPTDSALSQVFSLFFIFCTLFQPLLCLFYHLSIESYGNLFHCSPYVWGWPKVSKRNIHAHFLDFKCFLFFSLLSTVLFLQKPLFWRLMLCFLSNWTQNGFLVFLSFHFNCIVSFYILLRASYVVVYFSISIFPSIKNHQYIQFCKKGNH